MNKDINSITFDEVHDIQFNDIFDIKELQKIQDLFSDATGVASIITHPDGKPITNPSNFCRLCNSIIRKTEKGLINCFKSDSVIGRHNSSGPAIQPCLSGGLWDAGASISVSGKHIANWLIGQVRNEELDEQRMIQYSDEIGADREEFMKALAEVPVMSVEQFHNVSKMLYAFANELSDKAYNNLQLKIKIEEVERSKKLIQESRESLSITLHSIGDGFISTDIKGLIVNMNPVAESLCGWSLKEVKGKHLKEVFKIINSETREELTDPVKKVMESKRIAGLANHTILISKSGKEFQIADSAAPIKNADGEITGVVIVFSDVTEQYIEQNRIAESEKRYNNLINNLEAGIIVYAPDSSVILSNSIALELLGLNDNQLKGKQDIDPDWEFVNEDYSSVPVKEYPANRILKSKKPLKDLILGIYRPKTKDIIWLSVNGFPVFDNEGKITEVLISFFDITHRKNAENELIKSESKFRSTFDQSPVGAVMVGMDKVFVRCNSAFCNFIGYSEEELIGKTISDITYPDDAEIGMKELNQLSEGEIESCSFQKRYVRKDGTIVWGELNISLVRDSYYKPLYFLPVIQDITEKKRVTEELRISNELLSLFMEHSPIYAFIKEVTPNESRVLKASENFIDMIGVKGSEMVGKTMQELFPPEFSDKITEDDWKVVSDGKILRLDEELNGRHYTTFKFPISLGEKNLLAGYTIDINDRKLAEEELVKSRERFRDLIELAVDGVLIGSNEGYVIDANSCFCSIAGRAKDDIIGKHITDSFFTPDSLNKSPFRFDLLKKGEVVVNERSILRPDGTEIIIEMRTKMMPDGTYQSIFRDITKRKLVETEINLKNEELTRLNAEKDKFFSIIAHDLRSPFNGFLGLTEMMAEELSDMKLNDVKEMAVNMRDSAFNLFQLLENLLQWSQVHQGLINIKTEKFKLYQIINESLSIVREPAKFKEIKIINNIQTDTEVIADRNILQSIIRNLVSNAVKFTNKGGKIILASKINDNGNVEISITDSGIGMPQDMIYNLFSLNVKTNRAGTEGELSTGLGLILCKDFVEKHGGTISVISKEGKGSTFSFTLGAINE